MGLPPGARETRWATEYSAEPLEPLSRSQEGIELTALLRGERGIRIFYLTLEQAEELAMQLLESLDELCDWEEGAGL